MKVSSSCYAVTGLYFIPPWGVNAGFIVGREQTLIIDTGSSFISAQTIYGYAQSVRESNRFIVINTEKHLDHIGGNSFFEDKGIDIYGHNEILREEKDIDYLINDFNLCISNVNRRKCNEASILFNNTRIVNPNKKVFEDMELDLGNLKVLILSTPGHTNTNISIYVPTEKVLYCGDCIVNSFMPNLEEGTTYEWEAWKKSLDKIESISPEVVVPGHGNIIKENKNVNAEIYRIKETLDRAIRTGMIPDKW